jgi:hypothetical protein
MNSGSGPVPAAGWKNSTAFNTTKDATRAVTCSQNGTSAADGHNAIRPQ